MASDENLTYDDLFKHLLNRLLINEAKPLPADDSPKELCEKDHHHHHLVLQCLLSLSLAV